MNKKNKNNWKKSILSPSSTIKEAFSNLEETGMQIIFVCEEKYKY